MNNLNNMNMEKSTRRNIFMTIFKYALIAILASITAFNVLYFLENRGYIEDIYSGTDEDQQKELSADIETKIKSKIQEYNSNQKGIVESYRAKMHATIEQNFMQAEQGAAKFSENMGSYKYLAKLSYYFAVETIKGNDSAYKEIRSQTSKLITNHINKATEELKALSISCNQELAEKHTALKLEIEKLSNGLPDSKFIEIRMKTLDDTLDKVENETIDQANTLSVMLIIEGAMAKETCYALKNLLKPVISKLGVGAISATADGPLPVGDIITIACTAWTLYDLYDIKFIAPEKIRRNLISELNLQKNKLLSEIDKNLTNMAEAFKQ